jgi:acetolactate synthase-1/2/3 large subunit
VLALPENMLSAVSDAPDRPVTAPAVTADLGGVAADVMARIAQAKRPLVVVGGPHWSPDAAADLARFADGQGLPIAAGFRRQDYIDNRHANYAGDLNVGSNPRLAKRLREADLLVLIGTRFGDIETQGYTNPSPDSACPIIHIHADANEIGSVYPAEMSVVARAPDMVAALVAQPGCGTDWAEWTAAARADYDAWLVPTESPGALKQETVIGWLSATLPDNAIVTNGAGNYAAWLHRYFVYKRHGTQLAPTSGSMGYGFPAAISASLHRPDWTVVCLAGDGCFQMTCNELSTAAQHGATPIVVVMDNGRYGTIRMHQEKTYPGRVSGTALHNPDFAALARAYGGHGEVVKRSEDFAGAFARAQASGTFAVIACSVDAEALSTGATLSGVRAAAGG